MLVCVADVETDGEDPACCALLEIGLVWLDVGRAGVRFAGHAGALARYRGPLSPGARSAHHLDPSRLASARPLGSVLRRHWRPDAMIVACHNAAFDVPFLSKGLTEAGLPALPPSICTLRTARHLWPAAPSYGLGVLRYWRGLHVAPPAWLQPHRALYDAHVCAALLRNQLRETSLSRMLMHVNYPALQLVAGFGKHRGTPWAQVPGDYLAWVMRQAREDPEAFDLDVRYTVRREIERRRKEGKQGGGDSDSDKARAHAEHQPDGFLPA